MSRLIAALILAATGVVLWLAAGTAVSPAAQAGLQALGALALSGVVMVAASAFSRRFSRSKGAAR